MKLWTATGFLLKAIVAALLAVIVLFLIPGIYVPVPDHLYPIRDVVDGWEGNDEMVVGGYTSLDTAGFIVGKARVSFPDIAPLLRRALDRIPKGKVAKYPGLRVWLDEVSLSSATASPGAIVASIHVRARITNDVTGVDHKEKEVGITFDLGVDEPNQFIVLTCQIGNIGHFPGEIEQVMNHGCSMKLPICDLTGGIEIRDIGHRFIAKEGMIGIELIGRAPSSGVLNRALGMAQRNTMCGGKPYTS